MGYAGTGIGMLFKDCEDIQGGKGILLQKLTIALAYIHVPTLSSATATS